MRNLALAKFLRCFFFFQAEDGIRDLTVTGVQTCALPIYAGLTSRKPLAACAAALRREADEVPLAAGDVGEHGALAVGFGARRRRELHARSEEHTSELQSQSNLVCRLLLEKKKKEATPKQS